MASGSSSSANGNSEESMALEDLLEMDFTNEALPTLLECIERDAFDDTNASVLYSMLRCCHSHMSNSVALIQKSKENIINIAEKATKNDATLNLCAKLMSSVSSPEVLQNFTPDQQKDIEEWGKLVMSVNANPPSRGRKRKFADPKDEEIARLKMKIAALNEELDDQKDAHEKLLIRLENMDTQFNVYRYENERMLSEYYRSSQMMKHAYLMLLNAYGA